MKKKFRIVEITSIYGGTHFEVQQQVHFLGLPFFKYWTSHYQFGGENFYSEYQASTIEQAQRILDSWAEDFEARDKKPKVKELLVKEMK